jgi:DNA helicase-2/ATP-dependent DNA helicase PcrA
MSAAQELEVDELVERVLERSGTIEAYEAERTIRRAAGSGNLSELVGSAQEYRARADEPSLSGFLEEVQLQSDQDTLAEDTGAGHADVTIHNAKGSSTASSSSSGWRTASSRTPGRSRTTRWRRSDGSRTSG